MIPKCVMCREVAEYSDPEHNEYLCLKCMRENALILSEKMKRKLGERR